MPQGRRRDRCLSDNSCCFFVRGGMDFFVQKEVKDFESVARVWGGC